MSSEVKLKNLRAFGKYTTIGILFIISLAFLAAVGTWVFGTNLSFSLADVGKASQQLNAIRLAWVLILFVSTSALVLFWYRVTPWIDKIYGIKHDTAVQSNIPKKVKIVSLFLFGILISLIISGLASFVNGISPNTQITNVNTLKTAFIQGNIIVLIALFIVMAALGYMVVWFGRHYAKFQDSIPEKINKI